MIRHRTDEQVADSARQMDDALAAGLTKPQLAVLVDVRKAWRAGIPVPDEPAIREALANPAALLFDELCVTALRRQLHIPTSRTP